MQNSQRTHNPCAPADAPSEMGVLVESLTVALFWKTFHDLQPRFPLNHTSQQGLIAINLDHFNDVCRRAGVLPIPKAHLRGALPMSLTYTYVENQKIYSQLFKRTINCWMFSGSKEGKPKVISYSVNGVYDEISLPAKFIDACTPLAMAELVASDFWRHRPTEAPTVVSLVHLGDGAEHHQGAFEVMRDMRPVFTAYPLQEA